MKNSLGVNPDPNNPTINLWSNMVPYGISSVSLLPFIYCCPRNPIIWHTLNKLPFAPDTILIIKSLFSF